MVVGWIDAFPPRVSTSHKARGKDQFLWSGHRVEGVVASRVSARRYLMTKEGDPPWQERPSRLRARPKRQSEA
jgi:hypothetical protein